MNSGCSLYLYESLLFTEVNTSEYFQFWFSLCFHFTSSGTYDIYVKIDGADKKVGGYDSAGSFGELALMYNMPRAATIVATSDGTLWAMVSRPTSNIQTLTLKNFNPNNWLTISCLAFNFKSTKMTSKQRDPIHHRKWISLFTTI